MEYGVYFAYRTLESAPKIEMQISMMPNNIVQSQE